MKEQLISWIRILAASAAGFFINFILQYLNIDIAEYLGVVEGVIQFSITMVYYIGVRALSTLPKMSWIEVLLIIPKAPVYAKKV